MITVSGCDYIIKPFTLMAIPAPGIPIDTEDAFTIDCLPKVIVAGNDRSPFAAGNILYGVKTKAGNIGKRTDFSALIKGAKSMRCVFYHAQGIFFSGLQYRIHIAGKAAIMDGHNYFSLAVNFAAHIRNIHI